MLARQPRLYPVMATLLAVVLIASFAVPESAEAGNSYRNTVVVYFTRHAEKETELMAIENQPGKFMEICGTDKCSEILNAKGELRADLLADWFDRKGVTRRLSHAYSSHKQRTLATIIPTIERAKERGASLASDNDLAVDSVQQYPADGTELDPESTSGSIQPTVDALLALPGGSVALVAGHSGTLYKIMGDGDPAKGITGLNIDTSSDKNFPRDEDGKVRNFGDVWKVVIRDGVARLIYRVNLQPGPLRFNRF